MPIYEYACKTCGSSFEAIVQSSTVAHCPSCDSQDLERQMSVFAVGGRPEPQVSPGACGTCGDPRGPGACSLN